MKKASKGVVMVVKVNISSPSRAISLDLDTSKDFALLNGQKIKLDTNFYAQKICDIVSAFPNAINLPSLDTERFSILIDDQKYEGTGYVEGYDKLIALMYSLN